MPAESRYCELSDLHAAAGPLTDIRRHLHQHPELGYEEFATSDLLAQLLADAGYAITRGVGGTGLVATLREGDGRRSIGVRADMDALPIQEAGDRPYASSIPGKMHACGHDGHSTMLIGAARELARTRRFNGTVHLIFQPAEEIGTGSGAQRMIEDGLFERFPCDAIFGLHNHPGVAEGTLMFRAGPFMAASDTVTVTIQGRGGHAARPQHTIDPVVIASSLVMALQTIVSRNVGPTDTAVLTVGALNAGHAANVIPDTAVLQMSVRSFSEDIRALLEKRIRALIVAHVEGYGGTVAIDYARGYPVVVNSEAETAFAARVAAELVGAERVIAPFAQITGSEDFAYYLQHRPGCFLRIGNGVDAVGLHNPHYDFNDANLNVGAAFWTRLVERYLNAEASPGALEHAA
ncbi:MAG: M20 aminoacylase family protein [Janthinobacterium lividum]